MEGKWNVRSPAVKRILQELKELQRDDNPDIVAEALEENIFEWIFAIRGAWDTEFEGGLYFGRILMPAEYPFKPPAFVMLTPSGRFETGIKICLSISSFHPESWQPSWSVRSALTALIAFMQTPGNGAVGSLDHPANVRREMAVESRAKPPKHSNPDTQAVMNALHKKMMDLEVESRALHKQATTPPPSPLPVTTTTAEEETTTQQPSTSTTTADTTTTPTTETTPTTAAAAEPQEDEAQPQTPTEHIEPAVHPPLPTTPTEAAAASPVSSTAAVQRQPSSSLSAADDAVDFAMANLAATQAALEAELNTIDDEPFTIDNPLFDEATQTTATSTATPPAVSVTAQVQQQQQQRNFLQQQQQQQPQEMQYAPPAAGHRHRHNNNTSWEDRGLTYLAIVLVLCIVTMLLRKVLDSVRIHPTDELFSVNPVAEVEL